MANWLELLGTNVDASALERAHKIQSQGKSAAEFLLTERLVSPAHLLAALSRHYNLPYLLLNEYEPESEAVTLVSEELARRFQALPLFRLGDSLYVAVADPDELATQDYLRQLTGMSIEPIIATKPDLEQALNRIYLTQAKSAEAISAIASGAKAKAITEVKKVEVEDTESPAIKLTHYILTHAINMGASDIHLELFADRALLRYRVDGVLHEFPAPPTHLYKAIVSRMKIISDLDVAERRMPQDGRASITVDTREYDLRVSIIPNLHEEGLVIRVLDTHGKNKALTELGWSASMMAQYERMIAKPYGILLVTGPTGSGKSTTLYSTLKHIFTYSRKFITLEDPVEFQLDGITQIPVNPGIGFTFARGLRSILRHDPDVVMLGEIRDAETAEIAVRASLTGHLVFSTLHTNDAPSALTRLMDMGVQPFLVFSSLIGVLAQRLIRRLCKECKTADEPTEQELAILGLEKWPHGATLYRPTGCAACSNLGYKGRIAIHELLEVTSAMRRLKGEQITPENIREIALAGPNGSKPKTRGKRGAARVDADGEGGAPPFSTLRMSAVEKLLEGITSLEEVVSITIEE